MGIALAALLAGLLAGLLPGLATAQAAEIEPSTAEEAPQPKTIWVPIGVTLGWRGNADTHAFVVGGDVSIIFFEAGDSMFHTPKDPSLVVGALVDAVWVSNPSHFRATLGAEIMGAFGTVFAGGVEAGVTFHSRGQVVGFRARGFLTLLFATLYVGLDRHDGFGGEGGLLLKVPFNL